MIFGELNPRLLILNKYLHGLYLGEANAAKAGRVYVSLLARLTLASPQRKPVIGAQGLGPVLLVASPH